MSKTLSDLPESCLALLPQEILQFSVREILQILENRYGPDAVFRAMDPAIHIESPAARQRDTQWLKTAKTVGINVRTIQHFWKIVPYTLTLPHAQNAVHILPIWETGVVSSLYGPCSWNLNPEFYSPELATVFPDLDTVEKQLKVVVNLLHLLGKTAGMDVVPHTDRYSEQALANPQYFEWLQRRELEIVRHHSDLFADVQLTILAWLLEQGSAAPGFYIPPDINEFFQHWTETDRLRCLFGEPSDVEGRLVRRKSLMQCLYEEGFETVPATMAPPYRGLEVDPNPLAMVQDEDGRIWRDYRIKEPQPMSRVFGPLARYRLYESKDNNQNWELDFERPNAAAWDYVCAHYRDIQAAYNFDFMRGDMSHVQMQPNGVPQAPGEYYDLLGAVKRFILPEKPYFGYFAESFLAPPNEMAYGDECEHLEASLADSTLGDLQAEPVGTPKFMRDFWQYRHWLETRQFAPNFTLMTADKDDPRFDSFYLHGNEIRYFLGLFLTDMPSYMALGFECRDPHPEPAPNEFYTKLYVFQMPDGPKGTKGPYQWGENTKLYGRLARQKALAERIFPRIRDARLRWLLPPDPSGAETTLAWTQASDEPEYIFVANLNGEKSRQGLDLNLPNGEWQLIFSTETETIPAVDLDGSVLRIAQIGPGEGLVFEQVQP